MAIDLSTDSRFMNLVQQEKSIILRSVERPAKDDATFSGGGDRNFGAKTLNLPTKRIELTIYALEGCPYSDRMIVDSSHVKSRKIIPVSGKDKWDVMTFLRANTRLPVNHNTYPIVFNRLAFLGGWTDFAMSRSAAKLSH